MSLMAYRNGPPDTPHGRYREAHSHEMGSEKPRIKLIPKTITSATEDAVQCTLSWPSPKNCPTQLGGPGAVLVCMNTMRAPARILVVLGCLPGGSDAAFLVFPPAIALALEQQPLDRGQLCAGRDVKGHHRVL